MTGFLIKGIWTETHAHRRLRSELFYKPKGTKDGQRKPEARRAVEQSLLHSPQNKLILLTPFSDFQPPER